MTGMNGQHFIVVATGGSNLRVEPIALCLALIKAVASLSGPREL